MTERTSGDWMCYGRPGKRDWGVGNRSIEIVRDELSEGDARFIAAAPGMEKALETWLEWDGEIGEGPSPPILARAALAKARGE